MNKQTTLLFFITTLFFNTFCAADNYAENTIEIKSSTNEKIHILTKFNELISYLTNINSPYKPISFDANVADSRTLFEIGERIYYAQLAKQTWNEILYMQNLRIANGEKLVKVPKGLWPHDKLREKIWEHLRSKLQEQLQQ